MEEDRGDRMLIIGAGPVGLALARALKEAGVPFDHVEASGGVGGNWRHGVYETAHIISSRKTTEFDDWPMPESWPDFPSGVQMRQYYEDFARAFKLMDDLELDTTIRRVRPRPDGRWAVESAGPEGETARVYKGVAVCTGHHWHRRMPEIPGDRSIPLIHSKDYKRPEMLSGKRVLVIGGGNSACDVASEAARVGASCHLSLRRGYWFMPKTVFGMPTVELIKPWMPLAAQRLLLKGILKVVVGRYEDYGLPAPDHAIFAHHPTINSELLHYIKHGRITPRGDVVAFEGAEAIFEDGSRAEVDLVVAATGFHVSFPFLPEGLVPVKGPVAEVFGGSMVPGFKHLYIVGTGQVRYGLGPLVAPYARLLAEVIPLQDGLSYPLADVLRFLGEAPPTTHLVDPHGAIRRMAWSRRALPLLRYADAWLRRTRGPFTPDPGESPTFPQGETAAVY